MERIEFKVGDKEYSLVDVISYCLDSLKASRIASGVVKGVKVHLVLGLKPPFVGAFVGSYKSAIDFTDKEAAIKYYEILVEKYKLKEIYHEGNRAG